MRLYSLLLLFFAFQLRASDELIFKDLYYRPKKMELSGLSYQDKKLFGIADKKSNHFIYEIHLSENNKLKIKKSINLKKLEGFKAYYYPTLLLPQFGNWFKSALDLEGISQCGNDFYLVNEQVRHVLKVSEKKIEKLDIDFLSYFDQNIQDASSLKLNAGFEGIAIDCPHKRLYIAQERSPRRILIVNLENFQIMEDFTIEAEAEQTSPDFSGLYYENNYLYLLERNDYQIVKYDLLLKKAVQKFSFKNLNGLDLSTLYDTGEPFGIAEGLTFSSEEIFIALDNNKKPLSKDAEEKFKIKGKGTTLLVFKRPVGF